MCDLNLKLIYNPSQFLTDGKPTQKVIPNAIPAITPPTAYFI